MDNSKQFDVPFSVPMTHRLRFTEDVFGKDWQILADVLEAGENGPARVQFWLDENVAAAQPQLKQRIMAAIDPAETGMANSRLLNHEIMNCALSAAAHHQGDLRVFHAWDMQE